jgi:glycosyltransferase involved in cell wall biosynthesis
VLDIAVVIPARNEVATIRDITERSLAQVKRVIVVDDGSQDGTADAVRDLPITLVVNATHHGKGAALWRGMQQALTLDVSGVITLDADGQHAPEDIPRLIAAYERQPGRIIIAARQSDPSNTPRVRYIANKIANFWISWACGQRLVDSQSGFRLYPAKLLRQGTIRHGIKRGFVFESELLIEAAHAGFRCFAVAIPVVFTHGMRPSHYRHIDTWKITLMVAGKLLARGLDPLGFYRAFIKRYGTSD